MNKRERFLSEMAENSRSPYEYERDSYAENVFGEFEFQAEGEYFQYIVNKTEPKAVILDLACGDGRHTLRFAESVGEAVGLDFSRKSLVLAKNKCSAEYNVNFVEGSFLQLPFSPNTIDVIWFSQAFEYVPPDKRRALLISLNNVLKDSGVLYMSVNTWQYPRIIASLKDLWKHLRLFCYWKFIKRKPLLWGEYLEYETVERIGWSAWHYHVLTSKRTLCKLLNECGFVRENMVLYDSDIGYIYVLCRKVSE